MSMEMVGCYEWVKNEGQLRMFLRGLEGDFFMFLLGYSILLIELLFITN